MTGTETRQAWRPTWMEKEQESCDFHLIPELHNPNMSFDFDQICSEGILSITACLHKSAHKTEENKTKKNLKRKKKKVHFLILT